MPVRCSDTGQGRSPFPALPERTEASFWSPACFPVLCGQMRNRTHVHSWLLLLCGVNSNILLASAVRFTGNGHLELPAFQQGLQIACGKALGVFISAMLGNFGFAVRRRAERQDFFPCANLGPILGPILFRGPKFLLRTRSILNRRIEHKCFHTVLRLRQSCLCSLNEALGIWFDNYF